MIQTKTKSITKLICLLLVFIIPMIISFFLYYFHNYFTFHTTNYGTLVNPAFHTEELTIANPRMKTWQIVYVPSACADEKEMYVLHQLRKVLGKDSDRVTLTVVANSACANENAHDFRKVVFNEAQYQHFQNGFKDSLPQAKNIVKNKIYLVDPVGNLFMYYPDNTDPMNILNDLHKVLEVSQIG